MHAIKSPPRPLRRDDLKIPRRERKTINTLLPGDCRWPLGDPRDRDFHFCGKQRVDGHPYCEFHMHRGFQPARARVPYYRPRPAT
jgi:GcrA cell cycle regulator